MPRILLTALVLSAWMVPAHAGNETKATQVQDFRYPPPCFRTANLLHQRGQAQRPAQEVPRPYLPALEGARRRADRVLDSA